ncbi:OmpA family protein [Limnohabitans sp.]|jgi:OOP family OmpA-OmpF porin|uniref:OmpA family protein n=1 Tax=Limnohabitans sp. TaxID=1907725 RepID=UPI002615ED14|nr:OmpA family protein [Limnohabitans sp.]
MMNRFFKVPMRGVQHAALASVLLLACTATTHAQVGKDSAAATAGSVNIEAYGELYAASRPVGNQLSKVFFYRPTSVLAPQPVNIYLDGRYHTSLLRGGFAEACMVPGAMAVQSVLDDASRQHTGKQEAGQRIQFDAGKTVYLRLQESAYAPPSLQLVNASTAQTELRNIRRQIHTVSRVKAVRECVDGVEVAAPMAKPLGDQKFALQADALFEFGKAELRPAGYNAIELLVQKVKSEYRSVDSIRVIGFTDAIGPKKLNRKLSEDRAITVAEQIRAGGINPTKGIQTDGRGAAELVKTECGNEPTPNNKQCHAPNRRVEVSVFGVRN